MRYIIKDGQQEKVLCILFQNVWAINLCEESFCILSKFVDQKDDDICGLECVSNERR